MDDRSSEDDAREENEGYRKDRSAAGSDATGPNAIRSAATAGKRDAPDERPPLAYLRVLDALVYALGVTTVVVVASTLVSFAVGGGWGGVKYLLFLVGFFLFGVTAFALRPAGAWTESDGRSATNREETRFQTAIQATPPLRRYDLAPAERLPAAAKLFVASLFVLGTSLAMEAVFGVAA